jgi:hypothetical protein
MRSLAKIEIVLGLILVVLSWKLMAAFLFFPDADRHGFGLIGSFLAASFGGLFAFAGTAYFCTWKYRNFAQLVLLVYTVLFGIAYYVPTYA